MRRLIILSVVLALTCPGASRAADQSIRSLPVVDLSDLVVALLPADGFEIMDWDYMVDDPRIAWITDGNEAAGTRTIREGLVRVIAGGKASQILRQRWEDLPWTITLSTFGNPTHGPKIIEIKVGLSGPENTCFGTRFRGCDFSEKTALSSTDLKSHQVCGFGYPGNFRHVYSVSAFGKKPSLLVYEIAGGSGGTSSWLEIRPPTDQAHVCKPTF